ncbi:MAG: trypsin-like serine protease [Myxococcota bacterium]
MRFLARTAGVLLVLAGLSIAGCTPSEEAPPLPVGAARSAIINGSEDFTHDAVVAWFNGGGKCTATIIEVDVATGTGYALTAAHCYRGNNPPDPGDLGELRRGRDHDNPTHTYTVTSAVLHPRYVGQDRFSNAYDYAVLAFPGADASTPTYGVLTETEDNLGAGSTLELVGFGRINDGAALSSTNLRHSASAVADAATPTHLIWDQSNGGGGTCSGDSGGPALFESGGVTKVAAITHAGQEGCLINGFSGRTAPVYETLIRPFIDNVNPTQVESCDFCRQANISYQLGDCRDEVTTCLEDGACSAYISCISSCNTLACFNRCGRDNPAGKTSYGQIETCACDSACALECAGDERCEPEPACLLELEDASCNSCMEASCCAEATACASDDTCLSCARETRLSGCDENLSFQNLQGCFAASCPDTCLDENGEEDPDGEGGGDGEATPPGPEITDEDDGALPATDDANQVITSSGCAMGSEPRADLGGWLLFLLAAGLLRRRRD